ncbi:unnamed protein product [Rhizoctonia solani]|uniref:MYND-type domain-containing protein n=1 Tax=Rhizoctonia solani TaxID=456999 RepID=A0A8H2X0J8_9AGAM|nr:unnamed protein product [Rhizoctonia solani]
MNAQSCNNEAYCTDACQESDWPAHHLVCAPSLTSPPPGSIIVKGETVMGLAFLTGQNQPQRLGVAIYTYALPSGNSRSYPAFESNPALNIGERPGHTLCLRDIGGSTLSFPYAIFFRRNFLNDGSALNGGIMRLNADISYPWAGNIVVLKFNGSRRQGYRDIDFSDLPTIAQFFRTYSP